MRHANLHADIFMLLYYAWRVNEVSSLLKERHKIKLFQMQNFPLV